MTQACHAPSMKQLTLADFQNGDELEPCTGIEIPGICDDCEALDSCESRGPHAGCLNEEILRDLKDLHCASEEKTAFGDCEKCGLRDECSKLEFSITESQESRDEFLSYGCGCCGFNEKTLLCDKKWGIFCRLKKRIEYRCPIRHGVEPPAAPSLEQMKEWADQGLNARNGNPRKPARKSKTKGAL